MHIFCVHFSNLQNRNIVIDGLPRLLSGKEFTCQVGDPGWIPGSGRSPGEGNGSSLQYFYPRHPMDREAWWATGQAVRKAGHNSGTKEQQDNHIPGTWLSPSHVHSHLIVASIQ